MKVESIAEHSSILLTFIKRLLVLKTIFCLFESGRFTQVLLYNVPFENTFVTKLNVFNCTLVILYIVLEMLQKKQN